MAFVAFNSFQKMAASKKRKPAGGGGAGYDIIDPTSQLIFYNLDIIAIKSPSTTSTSMAAPGANFTLANYANGVESYDGIVVNGVAGSLTVGSLITSTKLVSGTASLYIPPSSSVQFRYTNNKAITTSITNLSVSWWMNTTSTTANQNIWNIGGTSLRADITGLGYPVYVQLLSATSLKFFTGSNTPSSNTLVTFTVSGITSLTTGAWNHFVITITSSGNTNVYQNSTNIANNITFVAPNIPGTSGYNWNAIGTGINNGNYGDGIYYNGYIDNFRIYNRIITTTEINTLYTNLL